MRRLSLLAFMLSLSGCIDSDPPEFGVVGRPCAVSADCAPELQCVAGLCSPADTCAAGIYVADELPARADEDGFPRGALVRQVGGLAAGVSLDDGDLRVVQAGEPRIFEIDYFDDPDKPDGIGLFVEARIQLEADSNQCGAVMYLWPTKADQIKICIGGGRIGLARPGGGSTGLVADVPDLTERHTYRIDFEPRSEGELFDAGPNDSRERFIISLSIDGELVATGLTLNDLPDPAQPADRAPLIGFGAEGMGTVRFDHVRWGCDPTAGPCRLDRQDDDADCRTERLPAGRCGGAAAANERCDDRDNDCDGKVDEDYTVNFPEGRPISFHEFGEEAFLGESCGLTGACAAARVVCSADGAGLICDASAIEAAETCDREDNDCDGLIDEDFGPASLFPERLYLDPISNARIPLGEACGLGACAAGEVTCLNLRPVCSTDAIRSDDEVCGNTVDDDCDGLTDEGFDLDGDGFQDCLRCASGACEAGPHDCDDARADGPEVNSDAPEICDAADNDCDGRVDEGFAQMQPDGSVLYTTRANCGRCGNDCTAASETYNTAAGCIERPGGRFECSTACQPGFRDADGGGAGDGAGQFWNVEVEGNDNGCECRVRVETVCDSGAAGRSCAEICNGIDDDCDGSVDEEADMDLPGCWDGAPEHRNVGICGDGVRRCVDGRLSEQCFGSTLPEAGQEAVCDGRDEDCDGRVDEGDQIRDPSGLIQAGDACNTGLDGVCASGLRTCVANEMRCAAVSGPQVEVCNGLDDDCDGVFEEDTDADGDGAPRCRPCANGEAPNADGFCAFDCNDSAANGGEGRDFSPNINEQCTGQDNDCDTRIDEDFVLVDDVGHPIDLNGARVFAADRLVYNQIAHCGACGQECARPNAVTSCDRGACALVRCREGFLNEDGNPDNGCEGVE